MVLIMASYYGTNGLNTAVYYGSNRIKAIYYGENAVLIPNKICDINNIAQSITPELQTQNGDAELVNYSVASSITSYDTSAKTVTLQLNTNMLIGADTGVKYRAALEIIIPTSIATCSEGSMFYSLYKTGTTTSMGYLTLSETLTITLTFVSNAMMDQYLTDGSTSSWVK